MKLETEELPKLIPPDAPQPGETWQHYRGGRYEILAVGLNEASHTPMVAYRCPESGLAWFLTLDNFTEQVSTPGLAGRAMVYHRFSRCGQPRPAEPESTAIPSPIRDASTIELTTIDPEAASQYTLEADIESLIAAAFRAIPPGGRIVFEAPL